MTPERYRQINALFLRAAPLDVPARSALLDEACADDAALRREVEALLAGDARPHGAVDAHGEAAHWLAAEIAGQAASSLPDASAETPQRIGAYSIVRKIGEGGMGAVYQARQEHPSRTVALKVIRPGIATGQLFQRFRREADLLGRLQHPGIAQIHEAGVAQVPCSDRTIRTLPFFAMELIHGQSLDAYAECNQLGDEARLELIARVCDAIQHAHERGVIHRDLKPGNIMVESSGQPKVLDFGVSRAIDVDFHTLSAETLTGQMIGTLPYMSPEQVTGDPNAIDPRSDVYSLGVVCYELLTGTLPYPVRECSMLEAARMIREEEPSRLGSINRRLRGDVETIVGKALEKDKTRRYQAAGALAADIRRFLADEPISARPPSATYQLRKFARRNRALVSAIAATFVVLLAGAVASTALYLRAERQRVRAVEAESEQRRAREQAEVERERAERAAAAEAAQREKSDTVAAFMSSVFEGVGPSVARGRDTTMLKELLDAGAKRIADGELSGNAEAELELRLSLGETYRQIADYDAAERMLQPTIDLARTTHGEPHGRVAQAYQHGALLMHEQGNAAEALPGYEAALEMRQRLFPEDHAEVAKSLRHLAICLKSLGRYAEALPRYEAALAMTQRLFQGDHPEVAEGQSGMAASLESLGRPAEALPLYEAALEMRQRLYRGDDPRVVDSLNNLGLCLLSSDRPVDALPKLEAALAMRQRLYEGDHSAVARSLNSLGGCLKALGRPAEALPKFEQALEMSNRLFEGDHPDVARGLNNVAHCLLALGRGAEALPKLEEALEMRQRLFPDGHPDVAGSSDGVAMCLWSLGRCEEAVTKFEASLEVRERTLPMGHIDVPRSRVSVGLALVELQRFAEAEAVLVQAHAEMEQHPDARPIYQQRCLRGLMRLYEGWDASEPGGGHDRRAAEWRDQLQAVQSVGPSASTQVAP